MGLHVLGFSGIDYNRLLYGISWSYKNDNLEHEKSELLRGSYIKMIKLLVKYSVWFFVFLVISELFIERGLLNFLPIFNYKILHIVDTKSVLVAGILPASIALGRFSFVFFVKYFNWTAVMLGFILVAIILFVFSVVWSLDISTTVHYMSWKNLPIAAYTFPLIGFFLAPLYPVLCSSVLNAQTQENQSAMTVLIMVFTSLGTCLGALATGYDFQHFGGLFAFEILLIPLLVLFVLIKPYHFIISRETDKKH